jgi:hypothetical protein
MINNCGRGAGVRWTPLPKAEALTEPEGETRPYLILIAKTDGIFF